MKPEAKKAVPDDNASETETDTCAGTQTDADADAEEADTEDTPYRMSLRDQVVIGLALGVALGLCLFLGTVLRVPGS